MWDNEVGAGSHRTGMVVSGEARMGEDGGMEVPGASVEGRAAEPRQQMQKS